MEFHELCLMFPQADDRTLADMADDISKNGLNDPIVRYEGKILDGRNRYLACEMVGIKPHYVDYEGDDPLQFVISKNLHRRHLNPSQLGIMAQHVWKMMNESESIPNGQKPTQGEIADRFNISDRLVRDSAKVGEFSSHGVVEKIMADDGVTVHAAVKALKEAQASVGIKATKKMTPEERETVQREQERILQATKEEKERHKRASAPVKPAPAGQKRNAREEAEEFNQQVLDGVYDGKRLRKYMTEIQDAAVTIQRLPYVFDAAAELIHTLEQSSTLNMMMSMVVDSLNEVEFIELNVDAEKITKIVHKLMARWTTDKFDLTGIEQTRDKTALDAYKQKFAADRDAVIQEIEALRKKMYDKSVQGFSSFGWCEKENDEMPE